MGPIFDRNDVRPPAQEVAQLTVRKGCRGRMMAEALQEQLVGWVHWVHWVYQTRMAAQER
jgi:hypothetical protein